MKKDKRKNGFLNKIRRILLPVLAGALTAGCGADEQPNYIQQGMEAVQSLEYEQALSLFQDAQSEGEDEQLVFMQHTDQIQALSEFLLEYATTLMGAGVHTNRAVRNISRIAAAYGYSADMTIFQRNITMSLICKDDETLRRTSVRKLKPLAFNLNLIQQLSELSWLPVDNNVSIAEMEQAFRSIVRTKRFSRWTDLILVSVGNAAFCRLFNGDLWAMLTVFAATLLGFLVKQQLSRLKYNPLGVIILSAFAASMAAACAVLFQIGSTPQIALATSVLFLVPGVQMINSIMDLMHGHILMGISRGVHSIMMISCITIGLSATMLIVGVNSL